MNAPGGLLTGRAHTTAVILAAERRGELQRGIILAHAFGPVEQVGVARLALVYSRGEKPGDMLLADKVVQDWRRRGHGMILSYGRGGRESGVKVLTDFVNKPNVYCSFSKKPQLRHCVVLSPSTLTILGNDNALVVQ